MTEQQPEAPALPGVTRWRVTDEAITEAGLAEALDGFWLFVASGGQRVHGQVANPDEVASVLLATLGRIAAERSPAAPPPVAAALDRESVRQLIRNTIDEAWLAAERAEAKLAELRDVLLVGGQDAGTVRRRAIAIIAPDLHRPEGDPDA